MKVKLKDVASFSKGQQINGDDLLPSANYAYLNGGISPSGYWNEYNIPANSIAISEGGNSCGYVNYMQSPFWCGAHCYYLFDLKISNAKYLYYALKARQDDIMKLRSGACMPNIKKSDLGEFAFEFDFDDDHQTIVVDQLERVERMIALRKQQILKLDELVKSRFIEMFGSIKNNHQRYPVVKIGSCAKLQGGFAFRSSDYLNDGIRLVQISNVNKDTLDWDSINCVPQAFLQKYKDFELHVGDLVLAMTRPVIKSLDAVKIATVSENDVPSLLNQRVGRFVVDRKKLHSVYLMVLCQMPEFREYVEAMSGNSLQPNISSKQVEDYSIVLPPLALQEQFAAFVEHVNKSKFEIQKSLEKLETLKIALMQKYFG